MKKVIIVSSSPRAGGNSETLAKRFADGAKDAGNDVKFLRFSDVSPKYCIGCLSCQKTNVCVIRDGMNELYDDFQNADVLVFATPVYYYSVSGQLKTFLDRLNPLYSRNNNFKKVYLIASAADTEKGTFDGAEKDVEGWVSCFYNAEFAGIIRGYGLENKGDAENSKYMDEAYEAGKNV